MEVGEGLAVPRRKALQAQGLAGGQNGNREEPLEIGSKQKAGYCRGGPCRPL